MSTKRAAWLGAATVAIGLVAGCSNTVQGSPEPDSAGSSSAITGLPSNPKSSAPSTSAASVSLADVLLSPAQFPAPFEAVVLPAQAVPMAAPDLVGVPRGATVTPKECTPAPQGYGPDQTVIAVGTDNSTRSTISVELTRGQPGIDELTTQTRKCQEMTVTANGVDTTVKTTILPPSPIDADGSLALKRTVVSSKSSAGEQVMLTLVAQVGDIRVATTLMAFGSVDRNTEQLDQAFTAAVQKVRAGH